MRNTRALLALALQAFALACSESEPSNMDAGPLDAGAPDAGAVLRFEAFDQAIESAIARYNQTAPGQTTPIAGASLVIVERTRGVVHQKGYLAYPADRQYLIASAGKILSVGVLMRLVDQGLLDLDAPISTYLSDWGAHKQQVTLEQLLSNSSGLPAIDEVSLAIAGQTTPENVALLTPHFCQFIAFGNLENCGKAIYTDDAPATNRTPDQKFRYGGSQWQLAGALAEQVSGKPWKTLVAETYAACDVPSLGYANQYGLSSNAYPPNFNGNAAAFPTSENPSIEGGAYITATDYAKLLLMHLRGGTCGAARVLSEASVARMQKDRVSGPTGYAPDGGTGIKYNGRKYEYPGYGLGWWIDEARGLIADPGLYGAYPLIDLKRGYALIFMIEVNEEVGSALINEVRPVLEGLYDAQQGQP
jgi:CubicO group peptidase (beta-lactamase class C family)